MDLQTRNFPSKQDKTVDKDSILRGMTKYHSCKIVFYGLLPFKDTILSLIYKLLPENTIANTLNLFFFLEKWFILIAYRLLTLKDF